MGSDRQLEGHGTAGADSFLLVGARPPEAEPNARFDSHQQEMTGHRPQVPG